MKVKVKVKISQPGAVGEKQKFHFHFHFSLRENFLKKKMGVTEDNSPTFQGCIVGVLRK